MTLSQNGIKQSKQSRNQKGTSNRVILRMDTQMSIHLYLYIYVLTHIYILGKISLFNDMIKVIITV